MQPPRHGPVDWCRCQRTEPHQHGTNNAYTNCRPPCRCDTCRVAHRHHRRGTREITRYPKRTHLYPAEPIRARARAFHAAGWSPAALAAATGIPKPTISELVYDNHGHRSTWATAVTAEAVQGLRWGGFGPVPAGLKVPSIGSVRRIQALAHLRWRVADIAAVIGWSSKATQHILTNRRQVTAGEARAIRRAYIELTKGIGPSEQVEAWAEEHGWAAPWQWDGVDIDDPRVTPAVDTPVDDTPEQIARVLDVLAVDPGATRKQIAARLGVRKDTIGAWCARYGRPDLAERISRNGDARQEGRRAPVPSRRRQRAAS